MKPILMRNSTHIIGKFTKTGFATRFLDKNERLLARSIDFNESKTYQNVIIKRFAIGLEKKYSKFVKFLDKLFYSGKKVQRTDVLLDDTMKIERTVVTDFKRGTITKRHEFMSTDNNSRISSQIKKTKLKMVDGKFKGIDGTPEIRTF